MTTVRERRYRVELWATEDDFSDEGTYICEIQSCQLQFTLSTIPQATITPLFGTILNGEDRHRKGATFKQLLDLANDRHAVKLVLYISQSFKSDGNLADKKEWEFKGEGEPDEYGQYKSDPIIIFQGFLCPSTLEITEQNAGLILTVQHWLSSLSNVSLLTTACHTSTPVELAIRCYNNIAVLKPGDNAKWQTVKAGIELVKHPGGLWKEGIQKLFTSVLDDKSTNKYNDFVDRHKQRARKAIEWIKGDSLVLKDVPNARDNLSFLIDSFLNKETYPSFAQTNAWDRLVYYSTSFLFMLVPRVKDVLLIPVPCTTDPSKVIELEDNDIYRISSSPLTTVQISRLICTPATMTNRAGGDTGRECHYPIAKYPTGKKENLPDGFIQAVAYPEWIVRTLPSLIPKEDSTATMFDDPGDLENAKKTATTATAITEAQQKELTNFLGKQFTTATYLTQAYNTTWANILMPARMDICLGTSIRCKVHSEKDTALILYGVVTGNTINFSSKAKPTTQLTLSFIRTEDTIQDPIMNPYKQAVGYYTELWDGRGKTLYD